MINSIDGSIFLINADETEKEVGVQDILNTPFKNGVTFREDSDNPGTFIQVNYTKSKIKTEIG